MGDRGVIQTVEAKLRTQIFLSDSENGIKSQIWVALIANLLFTVIERMTKKAEDFSTLVSTEAKNLCYYISFIQFLTSPELHESLWKCNDQDLGKMQLKVFEDRGES